MYEIGVLIVKASKLEKLSNMIYRLGSLITKIQISGKSGNREED